MSSNNERQREQEQTDGGYGTLAVIAAGAIAGIAGYFLGKSNNSFPQERVRVRRQEHRTSSRVPTTATPQVPPRPIPDDDNDTSHEFQSPPKICCICMKNFDSIRSKGGQVHATPCGHLFCHYCIYKSLEKTKLCPTCRRPVNRNETIPIYI